MTEHDQHRLNECAFLWKTTPEQGNEAVRKRYLEEIWLILFRSYDPTFRAYEKSQSHLGGTLCEQSEGKSNYFLSMEFLNSIVELLETYDPAVKPFANYFNFVMDKRKNDSDSNDVLRNPSVQTLSLDPTPGGDSEQETMRLQKLEAELTQPDEFFLEEHDDASAVLTLLVLFYSFHTRKTKERDQNEQECCRMMITDFLQSLIHDQSIVSEEIYKETREKAHRKLAEQRIDLTAFEAHEQQIFELLSLGFLDFLMEEKNAPHRTVEALERHQRKFKGELVSGESMTERAEPSRNKKTKTRNFHLSYPYYASYCERSHCFEAGWVPSSSQFSSYNKTFLKLMELVFCALKNGELQGETL